MNILAAWCASACGFWYWRGVRGTFWQQYLGKNRGIKQLSQMLHQAPVCAGLGTFYM